MAVGVCEDYGSHQVAAGDLNLFINILHIWKMLWINWSKKNVGLISVSDVIWR